MVCIYPTYLVHSPFGDPKIRLTDKDEEEIFVYPFHSKEEGDSSTDRSGSNSFAQVTIYINPTVTVCLVHRLSPPHHRKLSYDNWDKHHEIHISHRVITHQSPHHPPPCPPQLPLVLPSSSDLLWCIPQIPTENDAIPINFIDAVQIKILFKGALMGTVKETARTTTGKGPAVAAASPPVVVNSLRGIQLTFLTIANTYLTRRNAVEGALSGPPPELRHRQLPPAIKRLVNI